MQEQEQVEKWLKIATENKITVNNSWSVQLIDYFYQLHHQQQSEVNFTKASCTLDGCVKVYSTRVDAVFTETGRLLNGLVSNKDISDEDGEAEESAQGDEVRQKKKRKLVSTIEKNRDALTLKKFDLDYKIDPLFKKICADFDETGSTGLLLNHLKVGGVCKLTFSSYDQLSDGYEELKVLNEKVCFHENFGQASFVTPSLAGFRFDEPISFDQLMREESLPSLVDELEDYISVAEQEVEVPEQQQEALQEYPELEEQQEQEFTPTSRLSVIHVGTSDALTYFDQETEKQIETKRMLRTGKSSIGVSDIPKVVKTPRKKQQQVNISFVDLIKGQIKPFIKDTKQATLVIKDNTFEESVQQNLKVKESFDEMQLYSLFLRPQIDARKYIKCEQSEDCDEEQENIDFDIYDAPVQQPEAEEAPVSSQPDSEPKVQSYHMSALATNANALNYAKKAKRVDVKLLKQHIWNFMARGNEKFEGVKSFTEIYQAVQRVYPVHVAKDITPPFYFICILHLANEQVLKIEKVDAMNQLYISCQ